MWNPFKKAKDEVKQAEEQLDRVEEAFKTASYRSFYDAHQYERRQQDSYYNSYGAQSILPVYITVLDICSATYIRIPEIIEKAGYEDIYYKVPAFIAKDGALASCYYVDADGVMRLDKELLEACETVEIVR